MNRWKFLCALALLLPGCKKDEAQPAPNGTVSSALSATAPAKEKVTISLSCGSVGKDFEMCKAGGDAWAKKTGNEVKYASTPTSSSEALALYQQLLAAGATDIDVFQIDVVWPGILGDFFIDLKPYTKGAEKEHFPAIIANNTRKGRLVAMPLSTDAGILYYRKDLLDKYHESVPDTWEQLTATAKKIQDAERKAGSADLWGYVFQGKAYEGLSCNAIEWVKSYDGGTIVDDSGKVTINNPGAKKALETAASWIGAISPKGALSYTEEESRGVFQSGKAVFMRNWPYAWALSQGNDSPIKGKVGVGPLPKGGENGHHTGALGGWQLGVSKFSKHPEVAADLVVFLTSMEEQKRHAIDASKLPTIVSLYKDPDVTKANPFFADVVATFNDAAARPSTPTGGKYNQVSSEFFNAVHATLAGEKPAEASLKSLDDKLKALGHDGAW